MIELLAIKSAGQYCRFGPSGFELCGLSKATVLPLTELAKIKQFQQQVRSTGIEAEIMRLTITEEQFAED